MPWQEVKILTLKNEFVLLAQREGCNFSLLCAYFNISRKTGYKWLSRFKEYGAVGLEELSRRPHSSPNTTEAAVEKAVLDVRATDHQHTWGGRKIRRHLRDEGKIDKIPAASTITEILRRHGSLDPLESLKHQALCRFEHENPNDLWQMDFKGHFATLRQRCHPLTVLDDCSRFSLQIRACADETTETVKQTLINTFRRYGLPNRMTMDNGSPWGNEALTVLTVWLIRTGVTVSHSRPYHPQTQGKDERFHRTLGQDCISRRQFRDLEDCQKAFDDFRDVYNLKRPHEALGLDTPVTRYQPSQRPYPEVLPQIEYWPGDEVRKVQGKGEVHFRGKVFQVSKALKGYPVAFRPTEEDGRFSIIFCHQKIKDVHISEADA